jgi:hypothetical protein
MHTILGTCASSDHPKRSSDVMQTSRRSCGKRIVKATTAIWVTLAISSAASATPTTTATRSATDQSSDAISRIIPKPRNLTRLSGSFKWTGNTPICADVTDPGIAFDVEHLCQQCLNRGLPRPQAANAELAGSPVILVAQRDRLPATTGVLESVTPPVPSYLGAEGYLLEITPERLLVLADTSAGVYYGIQTICAMLPQTAAAELELPCVRIEDVPTVPIRGFQPDMGRGQVPTLESMKRTIERLGAYKLNAYFPYFEDGFHFASHPEIGRDRDRLEPEALRELVGFAAKHHVRIIPLPEALGHMGGLLRVPELVSLREGDGPQEREVLNTIHPRTMPFLDELFTDLCAVFPDPLFFAGTDECFGLGRDASKAAAGKIGRGGLFTGHIKQLRELLARKGRRLIISPDQVEPEFFKAFGLENFGEEFLLRIPRDVILAPWHYGRMDEFPFGNKLRDLGFEQILWGATAHCGAIFPQMAAAAENAQTYMRFAHSIPTLGGVASEWDSAPGQSTFVEYDWPVIAYFGECLWNPAPRQFSEFLPVVLSDLYGRAGHELSDGIMTLARIDDEMRWGGAFLESPGFRQFYRPMEPQKLEQSDLHRIADLRAAVKDAEERLTPVVQQAPEQHRNQDLVDTYRFALHNTEILCDLVDARHRLASEGQLDLGTSASLTKSLDGLETEFANTWRKYYEPKALALNLERFEKVRDSITPRINPKQSGP